MVFLLIHIALDVAQVLGLILVLFCYLSGIDLNDLMASSLAFMTLFGDLGLRLISRRGIMRLTLVLVLVRNFIPVLPIGVIFIFHD